MIIQMEENMSANSKKAKDMEKGLRHGLLATSIKVTGKKTEGMDRVP